MRVKTLEWKPDAPGAALPGCVRMVDQTRLPERLEYLDIREVPELWAAIREMKVRGAPAIGVAAGFGILLAVQQPALDTVQAVLRSVEEAAAFLAGSRPTAVNLFWALERMRRVARTWGGADASASGLKARLAGEAFAIIEEDGNICRAIGEQGQPCLDGNPSVLTHCNAGGLAASEYGTALAPIYTAAERGKSVRVFADETRPLLQGARLTAWELMQAGVDVTLICDDMAGYAMKKGLVDRVFVGADRIAANGDFANKIGTYSLAVMARAHGLPFYVFAPRSTIDPALPSGEGIPIEERGAGEITCGFGRRTAPEGVRVWAPAFDVTPARLVTAIVCERGILRPPYDSAISKALADDNP